MSNAFVCKRYSSGKLVTTATGLQGIVYNNDKPVNEKLVVHIVEYNAGDYVPVLDDRGQPKKMLCTPSKLQFNGFID